MTLALILFFSSQIVLAKVSVNVPTDLPSYKSIEQLEAYGCAKNNLRVLAPLTHAEFANSLFDDEQSECQAPDWLRVEREIAKLPIQPGEARLRVATLFDKVPLLGQEAETTLPYINLMGRPSFAGGNLYGEAFLGSAGGREWGFAGSVTPGFLVALDDDRKIFGRFYMHEGYIKVGYRQAELLYGRVHPEFGSTVHGALFLSKNAKPQSMIKFSIRPHLVGGPFSLLGPLAFETWVSGLGAATVRSEAKLWATAFAFRPWTFFEFGWLHAVQFGGVGAPSLEMQDLLSVLFYSRNPALEAKRRESTAVHIGVWGPKRFAKIYTQLFFSQPGAVSNWFANDMGVLAGLWFPKVGEADLRIEYVHTPPGLYSHSVWQQGWSTEGTPLGHSVGSDGEALYLDLGLPPIETWRPSLSFAYESRNRSGTGNFDTEWRYGGGAKVMKRWEKMEISVEIKQQSIYNFHYGSDDTRNALDLYSELRYFLL